MKNVFLAFVFLFGVSSVAAVAGDCSSGSCGAVRSNVRTVVTSPVKAVRNVGRRVSSRVSVWQNRRAARSGCSGGTPTSCGCAG